MTAKRRVAKDIRITIVVVKWAVRAIKHSLANRSVAGSGGDPNRGSFQPAFVGESIERMGDRSSDRFIQMDRVEAFASKPAPTLVLYTTKIKCGSGLAREGVST
ncbi:hypothetical protein EAH78_02910 [Pseudomonas arsenicoxydans]|uniref:Uncharacterized protein n=1 Tax=Pseudomonas arsenicoxydans TaxID=702115 RepID=A0A502I763_9PSED|nr:hypothetical protein EAH78_02910 [Pseudomonas arsenicoxydans]